MAKKQGYTLWKMGNDSKAIPLDFWLKTKAIPFGKWGILNPLILAKNQGYTLGKMWNSEPLDFRQRSKAIPFGKWGILNTLILGKKVRLYPLDNREF